MGVELTAILVALIAAGGTVSSAYLATRGRGVRELTEPEAIIAGLQGQLADVRDERDRCRTALDNLRAQASER